MTPQKLLVDVESGSEAIVDLTADEIKQQQIDQATAAEAQAAQDKTAADREALIVKLDVGAATDVEQQQALAQLLGGG